jgi:hypothetical protein
LIVALAQSVTTLKVLDDPAGRLLAVVRDGKNVGSIVIPMAMPALTVEQGLRNILRHPNGNDLAIGFNSAQSSFVVVFLLQRDGSYLAVDVTRVEKVNIGAIGPFRAYKRTETTPTSWLERPQNDDSVQIQLQTHAWDLSGRRYTMNEPLIITRDGTPLWR